MGMLDVHTVSHYARSGTTQAAGNVKYSDASTGTSLTCTVRPIKARERLELLQYGGEVDYKIFFESDPGSYNGDVFIKDSIRMYQVGDTMHFDESTRLEYWMIYARAPQFRQSES
jgi:hypothetical protein